MTTSLYQEEIKTPLRFHRSHDLINELKANCDGHCDYTLIMPEHYLMDFMISRPANGASIAEFKIISVDDTETYTLNTGSIYIFPYESLEYLVYRGLGIDGSITNNCSFTLSCDKTYYVYVKDSADNEWWSETFKPVKANGDSEEYVLNGTFETRLSPPWTVSNWTHYQFPNGKWAAAKLTTGGATLSQDINITLGSYSKPYIIEFDVLAIATNAIGGHLKLNLNGFLYSDITTSGHYRYIFCDDQLTLGILPIEFQAGSKWEGYISNVSVQHASNELECYHKLEWTASCNIGNFVGGRYSYFGGFPFTHRYWFPKEAELGAPEYEIKQEGLDQDGRFVPTYTRRSKTQNIQTGLVPEYIIDALFDAQLYPPNSVKLYHKYNRGYELVHKFIYKYEWEWNGACMANSICTFDIDDFAIKTGCCDNVDTYCVGYCDIGGNVSMAISTTGSRTWKSPYDSHVVSLVSGSSYVKDGRNVPFTRTGTINQDILCGDARQYNYWSVVIPTKDPTGSNAITTDANFYYDSSKWNPILPITCYWEDPFTNVNDIQTGSFIIHASPNGTAAYYTTTQLIITGDDWAHMDTFDYAIGVSIDTTQDIRDYPWPKSFAQMQRFGCPNILSPVYSFRPCRYVTIPRNTIIYGFDGWNGHTYSGHTPSSTPADIKHILLDAYGLDTQVEYLEDGSIGVWDFTLAGGPCDGIYALCLDVNCTNKLTMEKSFAVYYDTVA